MNWRQEMTVISLLYLIEERKRNIPTDVNLIFEDLTQMEVADLSVLKETMQEMFNQDLVDIDGAFWTVTNKGRQVLSKTVEMFDHALQFEVFGGVLLTRSLTEDEHQEDDEFMVLDYLYDPRFLAPDEENEEAEDLRIAMIDFLVSQTETDQSLDPRRIVFIQKLIDGELKSETFFFDLLVGQFFEQIEEIVESSYKWQDIAETEEEAVEIMRVLYTAGMLEKQKRDGQECSECQIPLAVFELLAKEDGLTLNECPNPDCGADYKPQTVTVMEEVVEPAEYEDIIEEVEEPVWGHGYDHYDYQPYGYYDPWDPIDDAAFLCFCALLW